MAPAPRPRIDLHLTGEQMGISEMIDLARRAESSGFGAVWVAEAFRDALVPLAAIAVATKHIEIGSNIVQWTRSAPNLELAAGDLAELSGDRFVLGIGSTTKTWNVDWHGIDYDRPLRRMREYVEAIRVLWQAGPQSPVSYDGEIFAIRDYLRFNGPLARPVPIALGASRKGMTRLAGALADRVHFNACLSPSYLSQELLPELAAGQAQAGRSEDAVKVGLLTITAVDDDTDQAHRWARHQLAFYVGVADYFAPLWEHHDLRAEHDRIQQLFRSGDVMGAVDAVPDAAVARMTIAGNPDSAREQLANYGGVVDYVMLYSPSFLLSSDEIARNHHAVLTAFAS